MAAAEREKLTARIDTDLMDQLRGLWAAEVTGGNLSLSLREVIERALRSEVKRAIRRGVEIKIVKRGILPVGRRAGSKVNT